MIVKLSVILCSVGDDLIGRLIQFTPNSHRSLMMAGKFMSGEFMSGKFMSSKFVDRLVLAAAVAAPIVAVVGAVAESALAAQYLVFENNNDLAIEQLYISVSGSRTWGRDRLRGDLLEQEENIMVNISGNSCDYDVKAIYEDGSYDFITLDICHGENHLEFFGYGGNY
jgi:hypothetical protein